MNKLPNFQEIVSNSVKANSRGAQRFFQSNKGVREGSHNTKARGSSTACIITLTNEVTNVANTKKEPSSACTFSSSVISGMKLLCRLPPSLFLFRAGNISSRDILVEGSSWKYVPVVIISSENVPSRISMSMEVGADEFVSIEASLVIGFGESFNHTCPPSDQHSYYEWKSDAIQVSCCC